MKILVLGENQGGRYNFGHQLFKDEIAKQNNVRFYGKGHKNWDCKRLHIKEILRTLEFQPDLILSYMGKYCKWVQGLADVQAPKAHIVIDYFPWNYRDEDDFIKASKIDLILPVCTHEVSAFSRRLPGFKAVHLPFSVDTEVFRKGKGNGPRSTDVMAVFSVVRWAYPSRAAIMDTIQQSKFTSIARASWPKTRMFRKEYIQTLQSSEIVINGVDTHGSLNWKFLEPCACGALLMTEPAGDMELLGFKDGVNCVVFRSTAELLDKIETVLSDPIGRKKIQDAGYDLVRSLHGGVKRVQDFSGIMEAEFGLS